MFNFEKLIAYQETKKIVVEVYALTERIVVTEGDVLKTQLKKTVLSVPMFIAEGMSLATTIEKIKYLDKAYCAISAVYSLLQVAVDLNYISSTDMESVSDKLLETSKIVLGLKRKLRGDSSIAKEENNQTKNDKFSVASDLGYSEEYI